MPLENAFALYLGVTAFAVNTVIEDLDYWGTDTGGCFVGTCWCEVFNVFLIK